MPDRHADGLRLRVRDEGHGSPALLLVHGFPLQSHMWDHQLRSMAATHRVLAPDLPGFGDSPAAAEPAAASVEAWADDLAALVTARDLVRPVVVGACEGGYVALAMARRHPGLLGGLVLVGTPGLAPSAEERAVGERQAAWLERGGAVAALADWVISGLADHGPRRPEVVKEAKFMLEEAEPDGLVAALHALASWAGAEPGPPGVPTLLVRGELDQHATALSTRRLQRSLPGADRVEVPGVGHLPPMEAPEAFDAVLEAWLAGR